MQLDEPQRNNMLVGLYCCDAQLCGVDNIGLPGFDRKEKQLSAHFSPAYSFYPRRHSHPVYTNKHV